MNPQRRIQKAVAPLGEVVISCKDWPATQGIAAQEMSPPPEFQAHAYDQTGKSVEWQLSATFVPFVKPPGKTIQPGFFIDPEKLKGWSDGSRMDCELPSVWHTHLKAAERAARIPWASTSDIFSMFADRETPSEAGVRFRRRLTSIPPSEDVLELDLMGWNPSVEEQNMVMQNAYNRLTLQIQSYNDNCLGLDKFDDGFTSKMACRKLRQPLQTADPLQCIKEPTKACDYLTHRDYYSCEKCHADQNAIAGEDEYQADRAGMIWMCQLCAFQALSPEDVKKKYCQCVTQSRKSWLLHSHRITTIIPLHFNVLVGVKNAMAGKLDKAPYESQINCVVCDERPQDLGSRCWTCYGCQQNLIG